jgi:hypothetical protein
VETDPASRNHSRPHGIPSFARASLGDKQEGFALAPSLYIDERALREETWKGFLPIWHRRMSLNDPDRRKYGEDGGAIPLPVFGQASKNRGKLLNGPVTF